MRKYLHCRYARSIGPKIQAFFEDYFAVPFPLPKQVCKKSLMMIVHLNFLLKILFDTDSKFQFIWYKKDMIAIPDFSAGII